MTGSAYPCKVCGMSPRNTIHTNPKQFDFHPWEEKEETISEDITEKSLKIAEALMARNLLAVPIYVAMPVIAKILGESE